MKLPIIQDVAMRDYELKHIKEEKWQENIENKD